MKYLIIKTRFRMKVFIRKLKKLVEFWKLYKDWCKKFDETLAAKLEPDPDAYYCPIHGQQEGPDCPRR